MILIGTYDSEDAALAVVRHGARLNGPSYIESLVLGYVDDDGEGAQLAAGAELLRRALAADTWRLSRPS